MSDTVKFKGWRGHNKNVLEEGFVYEEYEPKTWEEDDVEIAISHCGVCGSDLHTITNNWPWGCPYPLCVGHEIVGKAIRVGNKVTTIKVGDRVGVGAQILSCGKSDCHSCSSGIHHYCPKALNTYGGRFSDGKISQGGYADRIRAQAEFVFKIPDGISSTSAASFLCAGATMYSPLIKYGAGPKKNVGIVGIGGLGHFGLLIARALDSAKVVAISRSSAKKQDALDSGADDFIATGEDADWVKKNRRTLDIIVCTADADNFPINSYLQLLRPNGAFVQVGASSTGTLEKSFGFYSLMPTGVSVSSGIVASPAEIRDMLQLAADKKIVPLTEERKMSDVTQTLRDMKDNKARYRYVLVNENYEKDSKL